MADWIQQNLPNVYSLGWGGDFGWGIAIWQTIFMTVGSAIIGGLIGLLFGTGLVLTADDGITPNRPLFQILDKVVSVGRAIPFIIMVVAFSPLTQLIVGTTIGTTAALVPLSLGVFPSTHVKSKSLCLVLMLVKLKPRVHLVRQTGTSLPMSTYVKAVLN